MPIFESACAAQDCPMVGRVVEHYYPLSTSPMAACESCGATTAKLLSTFASPFMGTITEKYKDRSLKDGYGDGMWAWSRRNPEGKPKAVFIETFQEQREFCKAEGLARPQELPKNAAISECGKVLQNTCGMPGTEI